MKPIPITSRQEYDLVTSRGYNPLLDWRKFEMDIYLRIDIQHEIFGAADFQKENFKYYQYIWDNKPHFCEESGQPLDNYSSVHVSHIITKGADRRMAIDPRNCNLLTFQMHEMWEGLTKRKRMNIYPMNKIIIGILNNDYNVKL